MILLFFIVRHFVFKVNSDKSVFYVDSLFKMRSDESIDDENKFKENNAELAKALVEHKKTITDLKTESSKYQTDYLDTYRENQMLKTQLNFAKKTVVDLFKANTQNYTDVMRKLGISTTNNNLSSKSISSNANLKTVPIQRHSPVRVTQVLKEPSIPKKSASQVPTEKKDKIGPHVQKPTTSTFRPKYVEQRCGPLNAGLPQREQMAPSLKSPSSSKLESNDIQHHKKVQFHLPKIIITTHLDSEDKVLNISHTLNEDIVKRSPVGRKMNYDEEVNASLRELKAKRLSEKLSPVPYESNKERVISPLIKSTAYNATQRSAQAQHIAQARLSNINNAKSPTNPSKSPTKNIKVASPSTTPTLNSVEQKVVVESIANFTNISQQVDPGEGASATSSQPSSSGDLSNVRSNSTERGSSKNKDKYSKPLAVLKRLERQTQLSFTPKKFFLSPKENVILKNGSKTPNDSADALKHPKFSHSIKRQSDDSQKLLRTRTKSKENVLIDDEQPNGPVSNSCDDERHKAIHSMEMQSDDSNKRQARSRTRSRENKSIDDEQSCYSERPRRHVVTTNYAEPKLNTKMRRNF